jgi:hypothetical protein
MMIGRIIFLLEEPSMKTFLDDFLPRAFPEFNKDEHFICVPHEGKTDLEGSFPRKLRAWREPNARFVVMRDNDGAPCIDLKARYSKMCADSGRPESLVRLVCQELESWYLGDLQAIATAFGTHVDTDPLRKKFADPDHFNNACQELKRLVPAYQKMAGARTLAPHLDASRNRSRSFQTFVSGVERVIEEMTE